MRIRRGKHLKKSAKSMLRIKYYTRVFADAFNIPVPRENRILFDIVAIPVALALYSTLKRAKRGGTNE